MRFFGVFFDQDDAYDEEESKILEAPVEQPLVVRSSVRKTSFWRK